MRRQLHLQQTFCVMAPSTLPAILSVLLLFFSIQSISSLDIDFSLINIDGIRHALSLGSSCADIITKFLERIEKFEKGPLQLRALISVNPFAKEEAAELDKHHRSTGSMIGTLHCVPIMVGDNIDVAHMATTAGVTALSNSIAPRDADVVQLLKNQGAIVIGKGNVAPFAWEHRYVESQTGGLAKNAYCPTCTTYGASGGTAQAVAAAYALIGLGTDSGGSLALPASAASCLGLRPAWNLVSTRGVLPVHEYMDVVGPITRYAADMAAIMDVLDSSTRGRGFYAGVAQEAEHGLGGLRVGVMADMILEKISWPMTGAHGSSFVTFQLSEEVKSLVIKAVSDIKSAGAEILDVALPVQRIMPHLTAFGEFDITSCSADWVNSYFSRMTAQSPFQNLNQILHSHSLPVSFQRYFESALRKSALQQCDTISPAFFRARDAFRQQIMDPLFDANKDLLIFPMLPEFPTRIHDRRDYPLIGVQLAALAGYPSLTLPIGFGHHSHADGEAPRGLPTSVLLVAKPDRMDALIRVASAYQHKFGEVVLPESVSGCDKLSIKIGSCLIMISLISAWSQWL